MYNLSIKLLTIVLCENKIDILDIVSYNLIFTIILHIKLFLLSIGSIDVICYRVKVKYLITYGC